MKLSISEIFAKVEAALTPDEKIYILRSNDSVAIRQLLKMNFDKNLVWDLPEGLPPYTPTVYLDQQSALYQEVKRLYLFHKGGHPGLTTARRQTMFVEMLEFLEPEDAKLLIAVKDKQLPYPTITQDLINKAYPGLLVY